MPPKRLNEGVHRRGLPPAQVSELSNALTDEDNYWVQVLGFPPEAWGTVRNYMEMQCGHAVSEVRHPGCNWAFVKFAREADQEACLELDQTEWLPKIWIHTSKAEAYIVRRSVLMHNRPVMISPDQGATPSAPPQRPSSTGGMPTNQKPSWSQLTVPYLNLSSLLGKYYILPIIERW